MTETFIPKVYEYLGSEYTELVEAVFLDESVSMKEVANWIGGRVATGVNGREEGVVVDTSDGARIFVRGCWVVSHLSDVSVPPAPWEDVQFDRFHRRIDPVSTERPSDLSVDLGDLVSTLMFDDDEFKELFTDDDKKALISFFYSAQRCCERGEQELFVGRAVSLMNVVRNLISSSARTNVENDFKC